MNFLIVLQTVKCYKCLISCPMLFLIYNNYIKIRFISTSSDNTVMYERHVVLDTV